MRKIVAIVSSAILLFTCLACGIVLTAAAETSSQYTTAAYLDFSNAQAQAAAEAAADLSGTPGKTLTADAVYSRSSSGGAVGPMLDIKFRQNIPMSIGSVLAFKVKLDYAEQKLQKVYWRTTGSYTNLGDMTISTQYAAHTDWQLVMIPLNSETLYKEHKAMTESYTQLRIELAQGAGRTTDYTYIGWVGIFKSEADAMAHYALTTPGADIGDDSEGEGGTDDYTTSAYFDLSSAEAQTATKQMATLSFPGEKAAVDSLGVRSSSGGSVGPEMDFTFNEPIPMNIGSVLAFKVKLNNANQKLQGVRWKTTGSYTNFGEMTVTAQYAAHTDWQLVMIPLNSDTLYKEHKAMTESYTRLKVLLAQGAGHTNDYIYIAWAGIFKTETDAKAQYALTTPGADIGDDSEGEGGGSEGEGDTETEIDLPDTYLDFSTPEKQAISLGKATVDAGGKQYDALGLSARSVNGGATGPYMDFIFNEPIPMTAGSVLAFKVKLNNNQQKLQQVLWKASGGSIDYANFGEMSITTQYAAHINWQLVLLPINSSTVYKEHKSMDGVFTRLRLYLAQGNTSTSDYVYINWIGVFDNEEQAKTHFTNTTPDAGGSEEDNNDADNEDLDGNELTTNFYFDFSSQEAYDKMMSETAAGTNLVEISRNDGFNADNGGVMLSPPSTGEHIIRVGAPYSGGVYDGYATNETYTIPIKQGQYLAVKIKLSNAEAVTPSMILTRGYGSNVPARNYQDYRNPKDFKETTGWQLYMLDLDQSRQGPGSSFNGRWANIGIVFGTDGSYGDVCVAWMGIFDSKDDVKAHYLATTPGATEEDLKDAATDEGPTPYFLDLSSSKKYNKARSNISCDLNTAIAYDDEMKALKVMAKDTFDGNTISSSVSNTSGRVFFMPNTATPGTMGDYPYFIMKVKLADKSLHYGYTCIKTSGTPSYRDCPGDSGFAATEDWQLVVVRVDKTQNELFTGDWLGALIAFIKENTYVEAGQSLCWVEWAGAFSSPLIAYEYAGMEVPKVDVDNPTDVFWDFTQEALVANYVETNGDTRVVYDGMLRAMKVVAADHTGDGFVSETPGSISLGTKVPLEKDVKVTDLPLFAMRVKIENTALVGGEMSMVTTSTQDAYLDGLSSWASIPVDTIIYNTTTNWQTIIIDYRNNPTAAYYIDGDWISVTIDALSSVWAGHGDSVWIQWAGAFANMDDIEKHVEKTSQYEVGNEDTQDTGIEEGADSNTDNDAGVSEGDSGTAPVTGEAATWRYAVMVLAVAFTVTLITISRKRVPHNF